MAESSNHSDLLEGVSPLEFRPPARVPLPAGTKVIVLPPDPAAMAEKQLKLYTQNRIRQCFHALTMQNLAWVQEQLHAVAVDSPAKALELFLEIAKFSLPQLKETSVTVTQQNGPARTYTSSAELLAELNNADKETPK